MKMTKAITATFLACLFILGSCGKKNTVNSNPSGIGGISSTSPIFANSSTGGTIYNQYQSIRSQVSCLSGRNRLTNDVSFYVTGNFTGTTVGGSWQSGLIPSGGSASNLYVGVSAYRDLMFLVKVTNGSQVVGYNVILSFCEVPNAYVNYPALVSNDRALTNFQAPNGITINTATSCGYGLIAAAINTVIISQASATNPYTSAYPVYTSFAAPSCQ